MFVPLLTFKLFPFSAVLLYTIIKVFNLALGILFPLTSVKTEHLARLNLKLTKIRYY